MLKSESLQLLDGFDRLHHFGALFLQSFVAHLDRLLLGCVVVVHQALDALGAGGQVSVYIRELLPKFVYVVLHHLL